jgi:hypothetical protein
LTILELAILELAIPELAPLQPKNLFRDKCFDSNLIVMKTIRLHMLNMNPWIIEQTDIKIIHLIRDPRAMINSMSKFPVIWQANLDDIGGMCNKMMSDITLQSMLPPDRYVQCVPSIPWKI